MKRPPAPSLADLLILIVFCSISLSNETSMSMALSKFLTLLFLLGIFNNEFARISNFITLFLEFSLSKVFSKYFFSSVQEAMLVFLFKFHKRSFQNGSIILSRIIEVSDSWIVFRFSLVKSRFSLIVLILLKANPLILYQVFPSILLFVLPVTANLI
nr:hypothetical protein [Mycoplasmopsis cynos]